MAEIPLNYIFDPLRIQDRETAYSSCVGGRRYAITHQTPGTGITAQTAFDPYTPTFLLYQGNTDGRRVILSNLALCQGGTPAGGLVNILLGIDAENRYSSTGTLIAPQPTMADSDAAPGFSFRYNPYVSYPTTVRYLYHWLQPVKLGLVFNPDFLDGVAIGQTGSILLYTWAATTAPTWIIGGFDVMEEG